MLHNPFLGKKQTLNRPRSSQELETTHQLTLIELHRLFFTAKQAEGLRERTLKDHDVHFGYFVQ